MTAPPTSFTPVRGGLLQRKCACGGSAGLAGDCEACDQKKLSLQRSTQNSELKSQNPSGAPPIVNEVLNTPGQPLDIATRTFIEPRFGHDFSRVRIHNGTNASQSARAVNALGYTVGLDVVFDAGRYAPETREGRRLLAHELTHVVQQQNSIGLSSKTLDISMPSDPAEREADQVANSIVNDQPVPAISLAAEGVHRDAGWAERGPDPWGTAESPKTTQTSTSTPAAGTGDADKSTNHAKRQLKPEESKLFAQKTKAAPSSGPPMAFSEGPRFVLHDTSGRVELNEKERKKLDAELEEKLKKQQAPDAGAKSPEELKQEEQFKKEQYEKARLAKERGSLERHQRGERGPLDEAAAAYVPSEGEAVVARPNFFDPKRPTATQYEKRTDILALKEREEAFQKIWKATKPAEQSEALKAAFGGLETSPKDKESKSAVQERAIKERKMTPDEITGEQAKANQDLEKALMPDATKKGAPQIGTSASWAVGKICEKLKSSPAKDLANSEADAKELESGCNQLRQYLDLREPRIKSSVNVEIIQQAGSACETNAKKFTLVPLLPYTENQYQNVALLYLEAALQARQFPEITTHFWVDRGDPSGHCDPRCFNLPPLFDLVADLAGHAKGSTYGDPPKYGITRGTSNLWWEPTKVCGGPHP